jgi:hypothetical protein
MVKLTFTPLLCCDYELKKPPKVFLLDVSLWASKGKTTLGSVMLVALGILSPWLLQGAAYE